MKKAIAITTLALTSLVSTAAVQADNQYTEAKQGATFFTSAVVGAVAGGPVGFIAGALGGVYMGEQIKQADEVDTMSESLAHANDRIANLSQQLMASQHEVRDMQELAFETLSLPVLFQTGSDKLSTRGRQHVYTLAAFLQKYPQYQVNLDGHADPRGTDEYNNVLSKARAEAVKTALEIAGIEGQRILVSGFGSSQSTASKGDLEAYAQDRRVDIDLIVDGVNGIVMN